jgi:EmrB/QacA subfamily drug resistance transporter
LAETRLLVTLGLGVFAGALDLGVLSPALPALARGFGIEPRDASWTFSIYLIANVIAIVVMSKLADTYGRRAVYVACVALFAAGSVVAILAPSFEIFLGARALQAIGAGGIFPVATAAIADRIPPERRGSALGLLGAVWGLAAIAGPAFGGVVTHLFSWHWIFAANVPLAAAVILLAQRYVPAGAPGRRGPLDVAGMVALALGLLGAMIGLTRLDTSLPSFGNTTLVVALTVAALAFAALIPIERRAAEPVIAPEFFATRQLAVAFGLEILIGMLEAALFFIPAAFVAARGLDAALAGAIAAGGALVFVIAIPLAGRALDRFGSRSVLASGALVTACGLGLLGFGLDRFGLALFAVAIAGVGFGALLGAPTRYIVSNAVPPERRATAVGLLSIFLIIGMIFGASLAGGIIGADIAAVDGYRLAYGVFAALAVLAALGTSLLLPRSRELRAAIHGAGDPK